MNRPRVWGMTLVAGAAIAWAVACGGGGGGGSGTSGAQLRGTLTRTAGVATARLDTPTRLLAAARRWLGVARVIADGVSACGNPTTPADGVPVDLLLGGVVVQSTVTNADGEFTFSNLAPGDYVIQVTLPTGTISTPAVVQAGQQTTLEGELDVDCGDVDADGNTEEPELHVQQSAEDGSEMESDETEDGGQFSGDVKQQDGTVEHQSGSDGNRSDEEDVNEGRGSTSGGGMED
jgi:SdrD B-like protein